MARKFDVFERIDYVKRILRPVAEDMGGKEIRGCLCHMWYYKLGRRSSLTERERLCYDILLKHSISPKTAYEWFLLEDAPPHVKQKLREGKIGLKAASAMSVNWRRQISTKAGRQIMEDIRAVIGGLQWQGQDDI